MSDYFRQYAVYGLVLLCAGLTSWLFDVNSRMAVLEVKFENSKNTIDQMNRAVDSLEEASSELKSVSALIRSQQDRNAKDIERLVNAIENN